MKLRHHLRTNLGMTLVEVVLVVSILAFFAMLLVPMLARPRGCSWTYSCNNNLKQTALAYKVWAGDNNDKFPMQVSVTNGGTLELMNTLDAWKTFQVMSNELSTPKIIRCPEDSTHDYATNFDDNLKNKISYFIAASATDADPQMLLSGDDNFLLNQKTVQTGPLDMTSTDTLEWDGSRHGSVSGQGWFNQPKKHGAGNIALTDGSVQGFTSSGLTNAFPQAFLATNRLFIP